MKNSYTALCRVDRIEITVSKNKAPLGDPTQVLRADTYVLTPVDPGLDGTLFPQDQEIRVRVLDPLELGGLYHLTLTKAED